MPKPNVEDINVSTDFKNIGRLFNDPRYADFTLLCPSGQKFHVHRAIVCQNSTILDEICDSRPDSKRDSYFIDGAPEEAIIKVLVYLYTGQLLIVPNDEIVSIAACAARLGVLPLFRLCLDNLARKEEKHEELLNELLKVTKAFALEGRKLSFASVLGQSAVGNAIADRFINAILDDKVFPETVDIMQTMGM